MKKQILFSALLFFSTMHSMDKPEEQRKLLFPFPEKTAIDVWQMVRETYMAHHYFLESDLFMSLPDEIRQMIERLWLALSNPLSFNTSEDQYSQKMFDCCMMLSFKEKAWNLPIDINMTHDKKYYLGYVGGTLNIYDAKTKKCIRSTDKILLSVCQKKNTILCIDPKGTRRGYSTHYFYEIEKNQWHEFGERPYIIVQDCAQCITVLDEGYLYIWSFANIEAMVCHKIPCVNKDRSFVKLTSDGHILFGPGNGTIVLWAIENEELKELARYDSQGLLQSRNADLVHYDGSDYLILGKAASLGIKIEKCDSAIVLKKAFFLPAQVWNVVGKDTVLTYALKETMNMFSGKELRPMLSLMNYTGKVIQDGEFMGTSCQSFAGHTLYGDSRSLRLGEKALSITHVARDKDGYGIHFVKKIIRGVESDSWKYVVSPKQNLFVVPFASREDDKEENRFGCFDFKGKMLISFAAKKVKFHPHGHALLCENEDGSCKKLVLHPKGADEHFKKLAHKPLNFAQYASLETLCGKVDELRKALKQEKKPELP